MVKDDRPGSDGEPRPSEGAAAPARFRVFPGGARPRRSRVGLPPEVARRLARLERRVEEALAGGDGAGGRDVVVTAADRLLAAFADVRRRTVRELLDAVRPDDPAEGIVTALYRWWWRVDAVGLERIPLRGRVLIATNRSGAMLPYEALMIRAALARELAVPRAARLLADDWLLRLPALGRALAHLGAVATPGAARRVLERNAALVVYPEGAAAAAKPFRDRYRLAGFGRGGFARLAIATGTPVVPVAVIGAEEVHPVLARLDGPGRLLGLPTLPVTATFPWLGLWGLVPLPTKWTLMVGEPLEVGAEHLPAAADDAAAVGRLRDQVRERLQALLLEGLRRRRAIFRG